MIKIYQNTPVNCMEACFASLFEDKKILNTFPEFQDCKMWFSNTRKYIKERFGLSILVASNANMSIPGFCMARGPTIRTEQNGYDHCVIYRDGELAHDRKEGGKGLTEVLDYWVLSDDFEYFINDNKELSMHFYNRFN